MEMPVNGKPLVGIQVPNKQKSEVKLKDILQTEAFITSTDPLPVAIGKDVAGNNLIYSIAKMPHLLVAGSTGSGKSVWINNMLLSLLYRYSPADLQLVLVDMKRVELKLYEKIPHLLSDVITDAGRAINALKWAVIEMERRYKLLEDYGKRNISDYNQFAIAKAMKTLPYLVFVIDELGDLMMLAKSEVEPIIVRLTQMSRAVGIHIVLGTQRPDVQVVTGLIKANVPTRICFAVVTQIDSRVVLGSVGGEKLLGRGDGLVLLPGVLQPVRFQGANVDEDEVKKGVEYVKIQGAKNNSFSNYSPGIFDNVALNVSVPGMNKGKSGGSAKNGDMVLLYEEAKKLVETYNESSPDFIAESLGVDKRTAKKIIQELQKEGVIGDDGLF
jgi:S-DNA-T family DNA segregation ATPase FtsK/SpoIIIE